MKKTLQTNIAMNDSYDTRLCYTHTVLCHTGHSLQCWSEVLFSVLPLINQSLFIAGPRPIVKHEH